MPPSTGIVVPVTYEELSSNKNLITLTISLGLEILPNGEGPDGRQFPCLSGELCSLTIGVSTVPGAIALTNILSFAHSTARTRVSWLTAALDAEYAPLLIFGLSAETDDNNTILAVPEILEAFLSIGID